MLTAPTYPRSRAMRWLAPLGALSVLASLSLTACVDNERSIFIRGVALPTRSGEGCSADPDTDTTLTRGVVDLALTNRYTLHLVVGNQMLARGDRLTLRSESTRVFVNRAEVRVTGLDGSELAAFSTPAVAVIDPSTDGVAARYGIAAVDALDSATATALASAAAAGKTDFLVKVRLFGETQGGSDVETAEYPFPFSVCSGCLVAFPAPDPTTGLVDCASFTEPSACAAGQDVPTACGNCAGLPACTPATAPPAASTTP